MGKEENRTSGATKVSIGLGAALALIMSWTANKAILWALIHGLLGWLYVIYYLLFKDDWSWL